MTIELYATIGFFTMVVMMIVAAAEVFWIRKISKKHTKDANPSHLAFGIVVIGSFWPLGVPFVVLMVAFDTLQQLTKDRND